VVLHLLTLLLFLPAAGACLYYVGLALVGLCVRSRRLPTGCPSLHSFAIVIPAHNEESIIAETLRCCAALDYPTDKFQVFVIADNCADRTAALAVGMGASCLERHDPERHGKGHALEWALPQVLAHGLDAVLVLDADCRLEREALRLFDWYLSDGSPVLQAAVVAAGPDASATSYAVAVGHVLENDLFYRPKDRLGLTVFLRGTGMVLARAVLEAHPWQAHSIVEDKEYTLRLLRAGLPVCFVADVRVSAAAPFDLAQLRVQRRRWTAGTFRFSKRRALRLMAEGVRCWRWPLVEAGWTLLVQVKALLMLELLATLLVGCVGRWLEPGWRSDVLLALSGALVLLYGLYAGLGVAVLGLTRRRLDLLLRLPLVIVHLVGIFVSGVRSKDVWVPALRLRQDGQRY
jgi:cellulose synthase/poly-beta-1,6-N-acetylglucosamine synthase-like glycosyltransferase